jgi:hypothetical protein
MEMQQLIQQAAQDPRFQQALQVAQAELSDASPEQIEELIELFELMLQKPEEYQAILQAAIQDDMVEPEDMPQEFDATVIASALVVLYKLREGGGQVQMFARGGLAGMRTLARQGRMGDTMMAHISPEEAEMLKARGGAGTINPQTGYPQYFSLKKLLKAILPIALNFIAPGLGAAIGGAVGLSGAAATAFGGAIIGGASSALSGGNVLQGALMGGLGGGLGNVVGGAANKMLGLNLGQGAQSILGSGLVGGVAGAATGQGFLKGVGQGVLGGAVGQLAGGMSGPTAFQQGLGAAGQTFGQALTAGYDPKSALVAGGLSGLATGLSYSPSKAAVDGLRTGQGSSSEGQTIKLPDGTTTTVRPGTQGTNAAGQTGTYQVNPQTGAVELVVGPGSFQFNSQTNAVEWAPAQPTFLQRIFGGGDAAGGGGGGSFGTLGKLALAGSAVSGLLSAPPEVKQAASTLSPEQQEYFNRPSITWDWNRMQSDANAAGMSLSQFMARNWNNITGGQYNAAPAAPAQNPAAMPANAMPAMAHGGRHMMANGGSPLSAVARFARGAGTGRSDEIDAKLSDGEYVIDAETVAMLGDGSSKAGAQRLDQMREKIRSHKGKALAKGKFSPDAKSPLAYIKGVA